MVVSLERDQETITRKRETGLPYSSLPASFFVPISLSFSFQRSHEILVETPPIRLRRRRRRKLFILSIYMPHPPSCPARWSRDRIASMVGRRRWWGPWDQLETRSGGSGWWQMALNVEEDTLDRGDDSQHPLLRDAVTISFASTCASASFFLVRQKPGHRKCAFKLPSKVKLFFRIQLFSCLCIFYFPRCRKDFESSSSDIFFCPEIKGLINETRK